MNGGLTALPRWYHCETNVGRHRETNEDSHAEYALGDGAVLLVVADGMGGHEAGEVASKIAVEAIGHIVQNSPATDPHEKLRNGFLVANQRILATAESTGAPGMGTTAVAAYVRGDEAYVAHVGDSRLYHVRQGRVLHRTVDHTRVQKMISLGILPVADAKQHPDANVVTRALGYARLADGSMLEPEVGETPLTLVAGDSLVLCSDGLYDDVEDAELAQLLTGRSATEAAQVLVALANERGGHDNITVTVLRYGTERDSRPLQSQGGPALSARRTLLGTLAAAVGAGLAVLALVFYVRSRGPGHELQAPDMAASRPGVALVAVPKPAAGALDAGSSQSAGSSTPSVVDLAVSKAPISPMQATEAKAPDSKVADKKLADKKVLAKQPPATNQKDHKWDSPHPAKSPESGKKAAPAKPVTPARKPKGDHKASMLFPRQQVEPAASFSLSIVSATWDGTRAT